MMQSYIDNYFDDIYKCLKSIPAAKIEDITTKLLKAFEQQKTVFIAGNGGSASTATHLACDLSKTVLGEQPLKAANRFKVISLNDNIAILTAWANDEGYEHIFSEQLKSLAKPGDLLIVISASGNSPNIIKAAETAKELNLLTFGFLGFGGGKAKPLLEEAITIDSYDYGLVEGAHSVLLHFMPSIIKDKLNVDSTPKRSV